MQVFSIVLVGLLAANDTTPVYHAELVFPLHPQHNHAPGIAELTNGDLIVSWYRGSGERSGDDVAVYGARLRRGELRWSEAFLMADTPGFPDCNTCMMVDARGKLWLFWPVVLANSWESCLTHFHVCDQPVGDGPPSWTTRGVILLKPADFKDEALKLLDAEIASLGRPLSPRESAHVELLRVRLGEKLYQRLGWQPSCKPTVLPGGRILLPLYSDTFDMSIMAVSDDEGATWYASRPLIGFGNIQPTILRRNNGTLVAYMRENGRRQRIRFSESRDGGLAWGPVRESDLPNPGSGLDGVRLANGHWVLVYNDTIQGRNSLAVSLSDDEGQTWKWTRHLEKSPSGSYHYPAAIQTRDAMIHVVYSYFVAGGKSMKHAAFNETWVQNRE